MTTFQVTTENRNVIGMMAEEAGIGYEAYVNNAVQLGIGLGEALLHFSPEPIRIGFWLD